MQRSMTPNAPSPVPGFGRPAFGTPLSARAQPFMSGLMGGLIGAGIGGLLFGHGLFGGLSGFGGFLGFLLQIFLIVLVVRWLFRRFRGTQPMFAGGAPNFFARMAPGGGQMPGGRSGSAGPAAGPPVAIAPADYQAFEQLLKDVQAAWSRQDLNALRALASPEMVSYFAEQLADQASRGVRNTVTDVRLLQGDLAEAWQEKGPRLRHGGDAVLDDRRHPRRLRAHRGWQPDASR